jgi:transposase
LKIKVKQLRIRRKLSKLKTIKYRSWKRILKLEAQLKKNSDNSNLPPSSAKSDPRKTTPKKTQSLRGKSEKKTGDQAGHEGTTLKASDKIDQHILLPVEFCEECGASLEDVKPSQIKKRQVFELPKAQLEVIQYEAEVKICPCCNHKNTAKFPNHVKQPVQYGPNITAFAAYLHHYQMIPFQRMSELFEEVFSQRISEGTLVKMIERVSDSLIEIEAAIKENLVASDLIHLDETGCYVGEQRQWLHSTSNDQYTYYQVHEKRGQEAIAAIDILSRFKGTAIHDCWSPYFGYDNCEHGVCNVHNLRETISIEKLFKQPWANEMARLLLEAKLYSESNEFPLSLEAIQKFESDFDTILAKGWEANPLKPKVGTKRRNHTEPQRMLNRFAKRKKEIFQFLYKAEVPFGNNLAERDIRMTKVKQKISGTFRTSEGAERFSRIRGVMSTCKKQGLNILKSLQDALNGEPCPIQ